MLINERSDVACVLASAASCHVIFVCKTVRTEFEDFSNLKGARLIDLIVNLREAVVTLL